MIAVPKFAATVRCAAGSTKPPNRLPAQWRRLRPRYASRSKQEPRQQKAGVENLVRVDLREPRAGQQYAETSRNDEIVVQQRTVLKAGSDVDADTVLDAALEQYRFEDFGAIKAQVISVERRPQLRGELRIDTRIDEGDTRVYEARLTLDLVAAQGRQ